MNQKYLYWSRAVGIMPFNHKSIGQVLKLGTYSDRKAWHEVSVPINSKSDEWGWGQASA